ncbi:MAG: ATP-binding protein [Succinivibrionaceae bacterium]|nr:ATP-binding protein [Succinivibrionaceae bacterium]
MYIDPLNVLIGSNASGKSNVVDALVFISRVAAGVGIYQAIAGDIALPQIRGGTDWVCLQGYSDFSIIITADLDDCEYLYELKVGVDKSAAYVKDESLVEKGTCERRLFHTDVKNPDSVAIPVYCNTSKRGGNKKIELDRNQIVLYQIKLSSVFSKDATNTLNRFLSLLSGIFVLDPIPNHMRNYTKLSGELMTDGSNIAGVLAALPEERCKDVESVIQSYSTQIPENDIIRIWTEKVGAFKTDAMLYCQERWSEKSTLTVDARGMSDGTLRFLAIITAILTSEKSKLIVIEEVDNGLHPSRVGILLKMLQDLGKRRGVDLIVTTHNPALLDALGASMIPFVTLAYRSAGGASKLKLLEDLKQLPKLLAFGNIGTLATGGNLERALHSEEANV